MSTAKKIWVFVIGVVLVTAASAGGVSYSAWRNIESRGGLQSILQQALSDNDTGITSTIEDTSISFRFSAAPFRLAARNIKLTTQDTSLTLPQSEFGFSITNLIMRNFVPSDMQMSGLEIEILQSDDGWHTGPSMALITSLMQDDTADRPAFSSIKNIYISNAKMIIDRSARADRAGIINQPEQIILEPIDISLRHEDAHITGNIKVNNPNGGDVVIDFDGGKNGSEIDFTSTLSDIDMAQIYPYIGLNIPEIKDLGQINGRLMMSVNGHRITALSGDFITRDGRTNLPSIGDISFSDASILFSYDAVGDLLSITNFDMNAVSINDGRRVTTGKINFSGQVRQLLSEKPVIIAKLSGSKLPFKGLVDAWPKSGSPALWEKAVQTFKGGMLETLGLNMVGVLYRDRQRFDITSIDLVADFRSVRFEAGFASIESLVGSLSSRVELSIGAKGKIEHASADFLLRDAMLLAKNSDKLVELEGIELRANFDGNILTLTRGAIDAKSLGQMAIIGTMEIDQDWHPHRLDMSVKAEQIDKDFVVSLWPESIRAVTRRWIADRIHGGRINGLSMNMGFDILRDAPPSVIYLDGRAGVVDANMTYLEGMPVITGLDTLLTFEQAALRADVETGEVAGVDIAGSRMIIRNTDTGPQVDLAVLADGPFEGAVKLLDNPQFGFLSKAGLNVTEADGDMNATIAMKWHIPPGDQTIVETDGMDVNVAANVINASMDGLPGQMVLSNADIDVIMDDGIMTLSGRGQFDGAPGLINLTYDKARNIDLQLRMAKSTGVTAIIKAASGIDLLGEAGGMITAHSISGQDKIDMTARFDFTDTAINLDRFGLTKLPGEAAIFSSDFIINAGHLRKAANIDLDSEFLSISGEASFDESGQFLGAFFDEVAWPGNDISEITIERNEDDVLQISADAKIIDLTPLRREESPGEGISLVVDITANRIVVDERVSLSGNVHLVTNEDGTGEATFLGSLFLNGKPYMTESTLTAIFGGGDELMKGRGLIGGAEASISLSPSNDGRQLLVLRSNNAGQVLKALNIVDVIRSGRLHMVSEFHPDSDAHAMVNFELEDFRVIEAPTTVRMMSVLSLAGLYSLIEGDGTHFDLAHARVETFADRQVIHKARATGNALAVDLVGVVDVDNHMLEVSGALLPIYGITKLIGKVPILSEILTGVDNSGILVTQFTIDGSIDDPETSINLSSIVPGVFRDVFSGDWIQKEYVRLIGDDNAAPQSTDTNSN